MNNDMRNADMYKHWFWHSKFMSWVERALLDLTNWVWNKRHITTNYTKPKSTVNTPANPVKVPTKKVPAKKAPAKKTSKTPAKKKSDWNVK